MAASAPLTSRISTCCALYGIDPAVAQLDEGFDALGEKPQASALATHVQANEGSEGLLQQLYTRAKALIPASFSELQKRVAESYAKLKKFVEEDAPKGIEQGCMDTFLKLGAQVVVLSVEQCKEDLATLKALMNKSVAYLSGTGCFAFLKKLFYTLFYVSPLEKQMAKTEKTLQAFEQLQDRQKKLAITAYDKINDTLHARLDLLEEKVQAFNKKREKSGRNPVEHAATTDHDESAALRTEAYKIYEDCIKTGQAIPETLCRVANIGVALDRRDKMAENFLLLQQAVRNGDLSLFSLGSVNSVDREMQELQTSNFDFTLIRKRLADELECLARKKSPFAPGTPARQLAENAKFLRKNIPQIGSPKLDRALAKLDAVYKQEEQTMVVDGFCARAKASPQEALEALEDLKKSPIYDREFLQQLTANLFVSLAHGLVDEFGKEYQNWRASNFDPTLSEALILAMLHRMTQAKETPKKEVAEPQPTPEKESLKKTLDNVKKRIKKFFS